MKRTITGEVGVWLTKYSSLGPADLKDGTDEKIVRGAAFHAGDMAPDWARIGTAKVTFTLGSDEEIVAGMVKALEAERQKVIGDAQKAATDIDRQIQSLLAIGHEPKK